MSPASTVGLLWLAFGGTHVGLATRATRARLVGRLGEIGFTVVYSAIAVVAFVALVGTYGTVRDDGAAGIAAGGWLRIVLMGVVAAGVALAIAGIVPYPSSSYALFRSTLREEPRGLERITRHPFFAGTALIGVGHALLATRLVGTVFFAGLATLSIAGAVHQDRKLLAARGPSHAAFMAPTSPLPFAAIAAGRQRIAARELPVSARSSSASRRRGDSAPCTRASSRTAAPGSRSRSSAARCSPRCRPGSASRSAAARRSSARSAPRSS